MNKRINIPYHANDQKLSRNSFNLLVFHLIEPMNDGQGDTQHAFVLIELRIALIMVYTNWQIRKEFERFTFSSDSSLGHIKVELLHGAARKVDLDH